MRPKSTVLPQKTGVIWGYIFTMSGLALILYTTLFPFDFLFSHQRPDLDFNLIKPNGVIDYGRNVLLFIPFSFGLAHLLMQREKSHRRIAIATVILVGISLSTAVEILQLFISGRDSSLGDIFTNILSTVCGLLIFRFWGEKLLSYLSKLSIKLLVPMVIVLYLVLALSFLRLTKATGLDNWDSSFPLLLGNELSGNRSWQGTLSNLQITDHPTTEQEIERVLKGETADSLIAFYPLNSATFLEDQTHRQPDLSWHNEPPSAVLETGVALDAKHWLQSRTPVTNLSQRLADSSQFTLSFIVTTAKQHQTGPARIVSLSADIFHRNITVGQDGADLIIRLRTPTTGENGTKPELAIPNIFIDTQPHHLIITYDGSTLNTYIDTPDRFYTFTLAPHITFFRYLLPVDTWRIRINSKYLSIYWFIYYALIFIPIGFLLNSMFMYMRQRIDERQLYLRG